MTQSFEPRATAAIDVSQRLVVFEAGGKLKTEELAGNDKTFVELAPLLDEQSRCFVGSGPKALLALEAARGATAPKLRIILEEPEQITTQRLSALAQSEDIRRSDILIVCGINSSDAVQSCARLIKAALPRSTLLFTYSSESPGNRPVAFWSAVRDFVRWGPGFVIKR